MSLETLLTLTLGAVGGLYAIVIGQFCLLWYRMGRLEGKQTKKGGRDG